MSSRLDRALPWISRAVAALALGAVLWAALTAWGAVAHGHPAYAVWLALTALVAIGSLAWSLRARPAGRGWRRVVRIVGLAGALAWIAATAWLRPFTALEPALTAMESTASVTVTESATSIVMDPVGGGNGTGLVFYPGARVDPRAYAAHLAPLALSGHPVVVVKEPLGIAFLSRGTLAGIIADRGGNWAVAGHSLGGTVAAMEAEDARPRALVFWASYPAGDLSDWTGAVASISGSEDGLSTRATIAASRDKLPAAAVFTEVGGANHAQFGSYGPQPGDGVPYVTNEDARAEIVSATLAFLGSLEP
ncbi:alpha/beta hydrolase [Demequina sp.]|uniref:alpha/beta hydrolase n=1 Tax=Demequina sp. TaxID=2050685 RepID=UPI0025ECAE2E|nr:alpha/beta hydrolase [Demequina sp.]